MLHPPATGTMQFDHAELVIDAAQGLTQSALATYYSSVAGSMLPHVVGRPLTLVRRSGSVPHDTISDERGLMELVEAFALEIRVGATDASDPLHSDRLVLELEAAPSVRYLEVARAAKVLRALFEGLDLESLAMTRGTRGLDVIVPLARGHEFASVREFGGLVAGALVTAAPTRYTDGPAPERERIRVGVVGEPDATVVAAYSTQLLAEAPVALPAFWHELEELEPETMTPARVVERLRTLPSDPWSAAAGLEQRLTPARRRALTSVIDHALADS